MGQIGSADISNVITAAAKLLNENQGVLALVLFAISAVFAWITGIFSALRKRPLFKIKLLPGPTFVCTYPIGGTYNGYAKHRTAFALYLCISNVGYSPSSLESINIGYHWRVRLISLSSLRYRLGWFWLINQTPALLDFQKSLGENIHIFPFLFQKGLFASSSETYLDRGRSTNGVVYFEQNDSFGGCFPSVHQSKVRLKVRVRDAFGRKYESTFKVPSVNLNEARVFNPAFGKTIAEQRGEVLPFDEPSSGSASEKENQAGISVSAA